MVEGNTAIIGKSSPLLVKARSSAYAFTTWFTREAVLGSMKQPGITFALVCYEIGDLVPEALSGSQVPPIEFHSYTGANEFLGDEINIAILIVCPSIGDPCGSHSNYDNLWHAEVGAFERHCSETTLQCSGWCVGHQVSVWTVGPWGIERIYSPEVGQRPAGPTRLLKTNFPEPDLDEAASGRVAY
jgi:hypothetical protein